MADILHCLRISASPEDVFRAVTEDELLGRWWSGKGELDVPRLPEISRLV